MFPKFIACFVLGICAGLAPSAYAQTDAQQPGRLSVKFSPQHLLFNGIHLDVEKSRHAASRHSFIISPRFYSGKTRTLDTFTRRDNEPEDQSMVTGYGAEVLHRVYMSGTPHEGVYFAYGASYHHFDVEFVRKGWVPQTDEAGLEIYKYRDRPFNEEIDRLGAVGMMGVQRPLTTDHMLVDLYIGFGYNNSAISTDYSEPRYNVNLYDFGYTGVYMLGGLKLGVVF